MLLIFFVILSVSEESQCSSGWRGWVWDPCKAKYGFSPSGWRRRVVIHEFHTTVIPNFHTTVIPELFYRGSIFFFSWIPAFAGMTASQSFLSAYFAQVLKESPYLSNQLLGNLSICHPRNQLLGNLSGNLSSPKSFIGDPDHTSKLSGFPLSREWQ